MSTAVESKIIECQDCGESDFSDDGDCRECCPHEYDPGEGMMCINCSKEYPY